MAVLGTIGAACFRAAGGAAFEAAYGAIFTEADGVSLEKLVEAPLRALEAAFFGEANGVRS